MRRMERSWMFTAIEMMNKETSLFGRSTEVSTNNGILSTLKIGKMNQPRESSTKTSVS
jgi:hypothetical protein